MHQGFIEDNWKCWPSQIPICQTPSIHSKHWKGLLQCNSIQNHRWHLQNNHWTPTLLCLVAFSLVDGSWSQTLKNVFNWWVHGQIFCLLQVDHPFYLYPTGFLHFVINLVQQVIFSLYLIGTCTSLTCFWNSYRNAKRFPQSPSFFGNIFQTLMVMTLVFSKVVLGSMSFVYIPYFFPLALIGDFVVVILYNKLCFGHFYGKFDELKKVKCYLQMVLFFSKGPVNLYRYNFTSFVQDA